MPLDNRATERQRRHVADMHREVKLMYLAGRRHLHTIHQTYKCLNSLVPEKKLASQIEVMENNHSMSTRSKTSSELFIPHFRIETTKRAFRYPAPSLWALVNKGVKSKPTLVSFKYNLAKCDLFDIIG